MQPNQPSRFNGRTLFALMGIFVLIGGAIFTVISLQKNQEVRSRASTGDTQTFATISLVQKQLVPYLNFGTHAAAWYKDHPKYVYANNPSVTLPQSVTAGDLLVVAVSNAFGAITVTDNVGNYYQRAAIIPESGIGTGQIAIFYAENTKAGTTTITPHVGSTDTASGYDVAAYEYSGVAKTNALDKVSTAYGRDAVIRTGSTATTSQAHELVFTAGAYTSDKQVQATPDSSYRLLDSLTDMTVSTLSLITQDKFVTTQGTFGSNITLANFVCTPGYAANGFCATAGAIATFRAESIAGPTPTPLPYQPTSTPYPTALPTIIPNGNPTLGPVQNVHIDCPNCAKQY